MLIQYFLKTLDQQAGQDAMNLVTETLMDFLAGAAGCTVFVLRAIVAVVLVDGLGVVTMCRQELDDGILVQQGDVGDGSGRIVTVGAG